MGEKFASLEELIAGMTTPSAGGEMDLG